MEFEEWEPLYEAIRRDFGYSRADDERTRDRLAELTGPFDLKTLEAVRDATVVIAGAGPSLDERASIERAGEADVVIGASTAVDRLETAGIDVDCMVTDLDKNPETVVGLTARGTPVAVHAHGDNLEAVESVIPDCADQFVLPTTQVEPVGPVRNFGGFTDGDRAAFLADHLGAATLRFVGWDLDDPEVSAAKARKLEWAERLLSWLEHRRGERFEVLDGRRDGIDVSALPVE